MKNDWKRRNREPLTPEQLIHILNQIEGGERAKEAYRKLTGKEPPEDNLGNAIYQGFNIKAESESKRCMELAKSYVQGLQAGLAESEG